ncbi:MAG: hypothetical protein IPK14_12060 [Blastocatellia bacterium]|nr:hypothetical protein [Blastocatellia bacterium]
MYVFKVLPPLDYLAVMGILQSKAFLALYIIANQGESRVIPQVKAKKLVSLPFPKMDFSNEKDAASHSKMVELVGQMFSLHKRYSSIKTQQEKTIIQRQMDSLEELIDKLVYQLYGLTNEEIKILEETLKPRAV